jgi:TPR repeat protein
MNRPELLRAVITYGLAVLTFTAPGARADHEAGGVAATNQDYAKSLADWRSLADQGKAFAQNKLGKFSASGEGVPQDYSEALMWFNKAAKQGNADAQCNLGQMYFLGEGVPQDDKEASRWFRLSADQGNARAQSRLGTMYALGRGLSKDDREAAKWLQLAAAQGDAFSQRQIGLMYMIGKGVAPNDSEAMKWLKLSADQGDVIAQKYLPLLPIYKGAADAVDRQYQAKPPADASTPTMAITMMEATLRGAAYMRDRCIQRLPGLRPAIDLNLTTWKSTEAHAINQAETRWPSLVDEQPTFESALKTAELAVDVGLDMVSQPGNSLGIEILCKKYFADLSSGVWRTRTPRVYSFLDKMT